MYPMDGNVNAAEIFLCGTITQRRKFEQRI